MNGHQKLIVDLKQLLNEAEDKAFHDFENTQYAMPKVVLVNKFEHLISKVKQGEYDN